MNRLLFPWQKFFLLIGIGWLLFGQTLQLDAQCRRPLDRLGLGNRIFATRHCRRELCLPQQNFTPTICCEPLAYSVPSLDIPSAQPDNLAPAANGAFNYRGKSIRWREITGAGTEQELERKIAEMPPQERAMAASNRDNFAGTHRRVAKISISDAPVEAFANLNALLNSLKSDDFMMNRNPPMEKDADFDRVSEEERNVSVTGAIVAIKKEPDNDYHIILGRGNAGTAPYLNIEVSGLPPAGHVDREALREVRNVIKDFLEENEIAVGHSRYVRFEEAIPVIVTGSLFYDIDHPPGVVGPTGMRPDTSWEIHPVTEVEFR